MQASHRPALLTETRQQLLSEVFNIFSCHISQVAQKGTENGELYKLAHAMLQDLLLPRFLKIRHNGCQAGDTRKQQDRTRALSDPQIA